MKPSSNPLQIMAVVVCALLLAVGVYWFAPWVFVETQETLSLAPQSATTTVTVSAETLTTLNVKAARFDQQERLQRAVFSEASSSTATADAQASTTRKKLLPETVTATSAKSAAVIGRPPQSLYDTLVIAAGRNDGVELGSVVWWPAGVHLGQVTALRRHSSVVELVSTPEKTHAVRVGSSTVEAVGRGGDSMYAELPLTQPATIGAAVVSDRYNLPIGAVAATGTISARNVQALYITRLKPLNQIETVYVQTFQ